MTICSDLDHIGKTVLEEDGWVRRSVLGGPRLEEAVRTYRELGFEVLVRKFEKNEITDPDSCTECMNGTESVIYTRTKQ